VKAQHQRTRNPCAERFAMIRPRASRDGIGDFFQQVIVCMKKKEKSRSKFIKCRARRPTQPEHKRSIGNVKRNSWRRRARFEIGPEI